MNEFERKKLGEIQFAREKMNGSQKVLRNLINKNIKSGKYSYIEIKEVLHLIDREQRLIASLRR